MNDFLTNNQQQEASFTARLQKEGWQFLVPFDSTVLEAALASGISLPNSCRNGSCRTCICSLVSGQVAYKIEWPGLSREEKEEGMILPCVAIAMTDVVLDVPYASKILG